jgi:hypothetical protein
VNKTGTSTPEQISYAAQNSTDQCTLPDQSLCAELVQLYFEYVHDKFHSLFHRPSFMEDVRNGQAPDILLYGMLALSARYVLPPISRGDC